MSRYISTSNYINYIDKDIVRKLDLSLLKLKDEVRDSTTFNQKKEEFFSILYELEREAEALYVYAEYIRNNPLKKGDPDDYLLTASRLYLKALEIIQEAQEIGIEFDNVNIFRYRFNSAIGFFTSRRSAIATALSKQLIIDMEKIEAKDPIIKRLYELIIQIMQNNFDQCINFCHEIITKCKAIINGDTELNDWYIYPFIGSTVIDIEIIINSFKVGNLQLIKDKCIDIRENAKRFDKLGYSEVSNILFKLSLSFKYLLDYSVWNIQKILPSNSTSQVMKVKSFIEVFINENRYFIFHSQYEALFKYNILDKEHHQIVSMPTGAGKTFLGQLFVFKQLLLDEQNIRKVIYIVPTRALAQEKLKEFEEIFSSPILGYKVCKITGEALIESEEVVLNNNILIMTQEKFDMLIREDFYNCDISAVISDEFHNVFDGYRGLKLQLSLERFKRNIKFSKSNIFLISAILSENNKMSIAKWLYPEEDYSNISFQTDWQPIFSRRGFFDLIQQAKSQKWDIEFNDGKIIRLPAPNERLRRDSSFRAAAYIAAQLAKNDLVYLFSHQKYDIINDGYKLKKFLDNVDIKYISLEKRKKYLTKLKRILGEHKYCELFESGIAIHYGDLPLEVRRIVEEAFKDNSIPVIIATSTLAQGINLPIKTLIIPQPKLGKKIMDYGSFLNLIGRAGRPFQTDEGQIILLTSLGNFVYEDINKFLKVSSKDIINCDSPIMYLMESEKKGLANDKQYLTTVSTLETLLLALLIEGVVTRLDDNELLVNTLAFGNEDLEYHKFIQKLLSSIENRFVSEYKIGDHNLNEIRINELGMMIYKSGFTPLSSLKGIGWINQNIELLSKLNKSKLNVKSSDFGPIWENILTFLLETDEAKTYLNCDSLEKRWIWSTLSWMQEKDITLIASKGYKGDTLEALSDIEGNLTSYVAWGLFAMSKWANSLETNKLNDLEKTLFTLSNYVWYGTCDQTSLKLMKKDVSRRLLRDDVLTIRYAIKDKQIKDFINNPKLLGDKAVRNSIQNLQTLKISGDEVLENILKIYNVVH